MFMQVRAAPQQNCIDGTRRARTRGYYWRCKWPLALHSHRN